MTTKPVYTSWTFWFGVSQIILAALGFLSGNMSQEQALTLFVTGLGTIGFRLKTDTPVGFGRSQ